MEQELTDARPDQPAIHLGLGYHPFVESEFPRGAGRCDRCGGGPEAAIHTHVDPLERIAASLERIAIALEGGNLR